VIFDRAPVDYLAYSQHTADTGCTDIDDAFVASMVPAVAESLDRLDILAFVPKSDRWPVEMESDGIRPIDHGYRDAVDVISSRSIARGDMRWCTARNARDWSSWWAVASSDWSS
jgi:hypothetical protein